MDGDQLSGEPSTDNSITSLMCELCPQYMVMGMTYHDFWNLPTIAHKAYRKAYEMRMQREEWARWRQAAYIYDTILRLTPVLHAFAGKNAKPEAFPDEPWPITAKEAREQKAAREKANYEARLQRMRAASDRELKRRELTGKDASVSADNQS